MRAPAGTAPPSAGASRDGRPIHTGARQAMTAPNTLFYGNNLDTLRHHIGAETVDLVYLDPPFNSKRDYNVLFREKS